MTDEGALLEITDLHVTFGSKRGSSEVLKGIDLSLSRGEMLGIVGETGAGKSVFLEAILRILPSSESALKGSVRFEEEDLLSKTDKQLQRIRGRDISLIVSNPRKVLNPIEPVGKQIVNMIRSHSKSSVKEAKDHALDLLLQLEIPDAKRRFDAYPHELSGGMCQRIVIAMALSNNPKLILADEPTSGLDVTVQRQVLDLMMDLLKRFKTSAIIVTRDMGIVAQYCNRVAVMQEGKFVENEEVYRFFEGPQHPYSRKLLDLTLAERGLDMNGFD